MKHRRSYEPRIVGGKVVMMQADLQRLGMCSTPT